MITHTPSPTAGFTLPSYQRAEGVHPPLDSPGYRSTALRAPRQPLVMIPQRLTEITGPLLGEGRVAPAAFVATLEGVEPEGYAGCCAAIAAMDLRASLAAITAPTLVIAATEDPATPPWHGAVIARGIAGARLAVIRGAAHLANVSAPGEVTAALTGHLLAAVAGPAGRVPARRPVPLAGAGP